MKNLIKTKALLNLLLCDFVLFIAQFANASFLSDTVFEMAAKQNDVDPLLLYSVALLESAKSKNTGQISPNIYTLRTTTTSYYFDNMNAAKIKLEQLMQNHSSIDVGLMQVNTKWHKDKVKKITDLLDLQTNLYVGAQILAKAIKSSPKNLIIGVGRYHNSDELYAQNYGSRALAIYKNLIDYDKQLIIYQKKEH